MSATVASADDHLARGYEALASGNWLGAREAFTSALTAVESAEALDGLSSLDELIAEGDTVFLRSTMTGTHDGEYKGNPPTGRHIASESAEVFRIADGKFVGYWCLSNVAGLMRQLTGEQVVQAAPTAAS